MKNIPLDHRVAVATVHAVNHGHVMETTDGDKVVTLVLRDIMKHQACSATTARRIVNRMLELRICYVVHGGGRGDAAVYEMTPLAVMFSKGEKYRGIYEVYRQELSIRRQVQVMKNVAVQYPLGGK